MRPATLRTDDERPAATMPLLILLWGGSSMTAARLTSLFTAASKDQHLDAANGGALSIVELTARFSLQEHAVNVAASCEVAVVVVEASTGFSDEARRCVYLSSLFGVPHLVVAVDGLDHAAEGDVARASIASELEKLAAHLGFQSRVVVPTTARSGGLDATTDVATARRSASLAGALDAARSAVAASNVGFRFWVERVGPAGVVTSGEIRVGENVVSALTGQRSRIVSIVAEGGPVDEARSGDHVTLVLDKATAVSRGDMLTRVTERPEVSDQFAAHVVWLGHEHLLPGRSYLLRIGTQEVGASASTIKYRIDVSMQQHLAARNLELGEVGVCNLATAVPVAFDAFADNRRTGAFTLLDRTSREVVAVGMISFGLRRATNIHVEHLIVDKQARSSAKKQKPTVIWFTGLSGSGKSTIAKHLEQRLHELGKHTYVLDGDNVRHGLNRDLGFTDTDRVQNIRRIGEVAKLFVDAGLIVMCSFISPFRAERRMVRELLQEGEFVEVFVDASLAECQRRDPKGLYAKALAGKVKNFTGIDSPYEPPEAAEVHLRTEGTDAEALVDELLAHLRRAGRI